jgi:xanthine dehydrogenase small subunit
MSTADRVDEGFAPPVRDHVVLAVNGVLREVSGAAAFLTLSSYLREDLRLVGTKIVCSEGDCGACSVLVGELADEGGLRYRAIDSCIAFVYQLDGCHVITVDALARQQEARNVAELHPVQRAMAECYGSQCGFCTPGFVIAITDLVSRAAGNGELPSASAVGTALSGNLCRCTGYVQILDAVRSVDLSAVPQPGELFDEAPLVAAFAAAVRRPVLIEETPRAAPRGGSGEQRSAPEEASSRCRAWIPRSTAQALAARAARPAARVVAGATDLGVRHNKGQLEPGDRLLLTSSLEGFGGVEILTEQPDGQGEPAGSSRRLRMGALARWSEVLSVCAASAPEFAAVLRRFGGPQIRNLGTVGGNVINASPIADSVPFFFVSKASLRLVSQRGTRDVPIVDFYRGYKSFDLAPDELLESVTLDLPEASRGERVLLAKVSRRRDLDISTFTAALWVRADGGEVSEARVAYGGVGPTVMRLPETEAVLTGGSFGSELFRRAGAQASREILPISDVRGAAGYRHLLARNVMERFYRELCGEELHGAGGA